jgi:hypothetical protein
LLPIESVSSVAITLFAVIATSPDVGTIPASVYAVLVQFFVQVPPPA